ncbi:heliorhodopsin HeR [Candidatus Saccharibacteria bacterium]|nr:heliorhodopsin HeR [Candidatus Saccharibacteria bacterium]
MTAKTTTRESSRKTKNQSKKSATATKSTAVKVSVPATRNTEEQKRGLRNLSLRLGAVLLVLAIAIVIAGNSSTVPLTTQYLAKDVLATEAAGGKEVLATATRHLADINVSWLVAKFLVVFAALFILLPTVWRKHYEAWLDQGVNKLRWVGFGLGAGVAAAIITALSGISDIGYLLLIFASLAILGSLATVVDLIGPGRKLRKYVAITALGAAALPVVVIALTLGGTIVYGGNLPAYMYFIYGSMLLFTVAFALAYFLRLRRRGRWADSLFAERGFMLLGFTAAVILALQIFAGALQA